MGAAHGYGIAQMIRDSSRDVCRSTRARSTPPSTALERQGAVSASGSVREEQRVRIYRLTAKGRKRLDGGTVEMGAVVRRDRSVCCRREKVKHENRRPVPWRRERRASCCALSSRRTSAWRPKRASPR